MSTSTYGFLELLQELVGLLFLHAVCPRLHRVVRRQHGLKDLLDSVGRHGGGGLVGSGGRAGGEVAARAGTRCRASTEAS